MRYYHFITLMIHVDYITSEVNHRMTIEKSYELYLKGEKPREIIKFWDNGITVNNLRVKLHRYKNKKEKTP